MPYSSTSDLPAQAKNLSPKQKRAFLQAFNSAHRDGKSEKSAFRIAWAAAKKSDGEETSKHLEGQHDQKEHGNRIRRLTGGISEKQRQKVISEVQGKDFDDTFDNIVDFLQGRDSGIEYGFVVDQAGKVVDYNVGKEEGVEPIRDKIRDKSDIKELSLIHRHPTAEQQTSGKDPEKIVEGGRALSPADMMTGLTGFKSVTAVNDRGYAKFTMPDAPSIQKDPKGALGFMQGQVAGMHSVLMHEKNGSFQRMVNRISEKHGEGSDSIRRIRREAEDRLNQEWRYWVSNVLPELGVEGASYKVKHQPKKVAKRFVDPVDQCSIRTMYQLGNLPAYYAKKVKG